MHSLPADQPFTCDSDLYLTVCRHVVAAESCKLSTPDRSCGCCVVRGVCCIHEEVCAGYGCGAHMLQYCPRAAAALTQGPAQNIRHHAEPTTLFCGARRDTHPVSEPSPLQLAPVKGLITGYQESCCSDPVSCSSSCTIWNKLTQFIVGMLTAKQDLPEDSHNCTCWTCS